MPELPEVETVRRGLESDVVGRTVTGVDATGARSVRRMPKEELVARVAGHTITAAGRRGKYLTLPLDSGDAVVVHLRMSGQLLLQDAATPRPKHTHVVLALGEEELRFVDPRTFGEVFVVRADASALPGLGWDPLHEPTAWRGAAEVVQRRRAPLKALLTDQAVIAGLGNIYSDEVLHDAKLRHDRAGRSLSASERRRLFRSIPAILDAAIAARGSSLADQQYVDLYGRVGGYQLQHRVYARAGQPCLRCRGTITREKWHGRSTFFCPDCQR